MDLGSSSLILPEKNCSAQKKNFFHYFFSIKVFLGQKVLRQYKAYSRTKQKGVYLGVQIGNIDVKKCNYIFAFLAELAHYSHPYPIPDSLRYDIIAPSEQDVS